MFFFGFLFLFCSTNTIQSCLLAQSTLAFADLDFLQCWKKKVKQGRECSLLLEHKNGKVSTTLKVSNAARSEARAPKTDSKSLAENKNPKKSGSKLAKLLAYGQFQTSLSDSFQHIFTLILVKWRSIILFYKPKYPFIIEYLMHDNKNNF